MPKIQVHISDKMLKRLQNCAIAKKISISQLVRQQLEQSFETRWPKNYFALFGSVQDVGFQRPKSLTD